MEKIVEEEKRRLGQGDNHQEDTKAVEEEKREGIIPSDLYAEEILPRLPTNDLLNFKTVCKGWLRLISSPQFIRNHLCQSNRSRILMPSPSAIIDYNNYEDNISKEIPYPPEFSPNSTRILGSCDGLICLLDKGSRRKLAVINPSTGKSRDVGLECVADFRRILCSWFGHHPSSRAGEYVLVMGRLSVQPSFRYEIGVYKFTRRPNLKPIHSTSCPIDLQVPSYYKALEETGTLLHGAVHWPAGWVNVDAHSQSRCIISAYDLDKNKHLEISPPAQCQVKLGVMDGCLFAILRPRDVFELWVMKEYGVEESWMKFRNIEGYGHCRALSPLGFSPNGGDLILDVDRSKLIKYNFDDNKATLLKVRESDAQAIVCADSLVSPAIWGSRIALKRDYKLKSHFP